MPTAEDDVYITGGDVLLSDVRELKSLTVGAEGTLTVATNISVIGSVTIEDGGTLLWDKPSTIEGNLSILDGGLMSHSPNDKTEANKIDLKVLGDGYISSDGAIDVTGKGYGETSGPGYNTVAASGCSHGGRGRLYNTANLCYGSIVSPTNCGSGGHSKKFGGGAVILSFAGHLELAGSVIANGIGLSKDDSPHYCGSGGSVNITAGSLSGNGLVSANGGDHPTGGWMSGGGRVALKVTNAGADFRDFNGPVEAYASRVLNGSMHGAPGTIYWETAAQAGGLGTMTVDATLAALVDGKQWKTDYPSTLLCEEGETEKIKVILKGNSFLDLMCDTTVEDIHLEGKEPTLRLRGRTLTVRTKQHPLGEDESKQVDYSEGGEILWIPHDSGLILLIR